MWIPWEYVQQKPDHEKMWQTAHIFHQSNCKWEKRDGRGPYRLKETWDISATWNICTLFEFWLKQIIQIAYETTGKFEHWLIILWW